MKMAFFKAKPEHAAPRIAPVPEGQDERRNGVLINEEKRCLRIEIFDHGNDEDLQLALGILEVAKDVAKQTLSAWHMKEAQRKAILVPTGARKGNGLHVQ